LKRKLLILSMVLLLTCAALNAHAEERSVCLPIVMYHHISQNPEKWNDYVVSEKEFESDLEWLTQHGYETVSVSELLAWYEGGFTMPEKPVMLTFDDGFESTEAYAEPLLNKYGYKGVVAVIGSVCDKFSQCGEHDPELSNMSWEDVREMSERGVIEVQCHTWNMHTLQPRRGCSRMRGESREDYRSALSRDLSRFLTESNLHGVTLTQTIAYPYGAYTDMTTETVRDFGFLAAFTCTEKRNILTGDRSELYLLGRFNRAHGIGSEEFFYAWEK